MSDLDKQYQETLHFLYERLPMYTRVGASAYKKDLTNTLAFCDYFDHPEKKIKTVHIGGTNGKGSTTNYLASICMEAGYRVGIYTSPHLIDFRERIKIGNEMIPQDYIMSFVEDSKPIIEKIQPSFFELTVVMALKYFADMSVDMALIEVGLGGRLDSTNVITPILSIITNVSYDHMNMLGNSLSEIASEKAGIIKNQIPIIIGESQPEVRPIFVGKATEVNAPLFVAEDRTIIELNSQIIQLQNNTLSVKLPITHMQPSYKLKNIITVLEAYTNMVERGFIEIESKNRESVFVKGIENFSQNTGFIGRWTSIHYRGKRIILECAHNEAGVEEFKRSIAFESFEKLIIIYGTVRDKDVSKIISILPQDKHYQYILTKANIPRALPVHELATYFRDNQYQSFIEEYTAKQALDKAISLAQENDLILVTGSIFVVGEVLSFLRS